ncbi:MAG: hypothetical protein ACYTGL_12020 [Planctomycetota bacterium]
MPQDIQATNADWAWAPFEPSADVPWNRLASAHLCRRAGFGATSEERWYNGLRVRSSSLSLRARYPQQHSTRKTIRSQQPCWRPAILEACRRGGCTAC